MPKRGENIYKRKDGRWEGRTTITLDDLSSKKKSVYGHSYKEVRLKLLELKAGKSCENHKVPTFQNALEDWLKRKQTTVKISTYNKYHNLIYNYINPSLGSFFIDDIDSIKVNTFISMLLNKERKNGSRGISPKSIRDICMIIKSCLKYSSALYSIETRPLELYIPASPQKDVQTLTLNEQRILEQYPRTDTDLKKIGVLVCLYMGLRIGEICALKWENINFSEGLLFVETTLQRVQNFDSGDSRTMVLESVPKSQCSIRTIPIPDKIIALIEPLKPTNESAYFLTGVEGKYIEPRMYEYIFRKYVTASGISNINFHALRHTFATRCIELNFDIKSLSEILGHSNTKITLDRYVHPSIELKRSQMNRLAL